MEELLHRCNALLKGFDNDFSGINLEQEQLWLEVQGKQSAQSREARLIFNGDGRVHEFDDLGNTWIKSALYASSHSASLDDQGKRIEEIDDTEDDSTVQKQNRFKTSILLARLIRNIVADNSIGQNIYFATIPYALKTLWYTTSFALEDDQEAKLLTRALVQMVSNIITENDELQDVLWNDHLGLGDANSTPKIGNERAPSDLLCRLLDSRDVTIRTATQVLLVNMILTSTRRSKQIASTPAGASIMKSLLHDVETSLEVDEKEEEEEDAERLRSDGDSGYGVSLQPSVEILKQRQDRYEGLGVLYAFFKGLFKEGLFDQTYENLQPIDFEGSQIDKSIVSSAQITLLKLLDASLHSDNAKEYPFKDGDLQCLSKTFLFLAEWAENTMKATLKQGVNAAVDGRLVEVHIALILVLQCLLSIAMTTEAMRETEIGQTCELIVEKMRQDDFVIQLLTLMRTTSIFSPPISPFVPTVGQTNKEAPNGHVLSSTGRANKDTEHNQNRPKLDKLKRDLVGLLGVIAFKRGKDDEIVVRRVQDLVRTQGGLLDVLNLTQLDERNPYIRERAIFALRNLLHSNQASQDVIGELQPIDPAQQGLQ